ncbi:SusC/RagA family TonB-linked outer membrane protein [Parabacteroides pacaensis]|uniref:SusC/RagA family TonB-linked outer membrane protein n=1 Tax=Parabacteroides pacaensis TaxID=2086575 RepID=UPI000D0FA176|nr:TonB-dependent receptor [Parabacteroides pacaensis]
MNNKILNFRVTAILMLLYTLLGGAYPLHAQQAQDRHISGLVIDETKEPLIGVNILVVGTSVGAVTDIDGKYTLTVPAGATQLTFSYIGYQAKTVSIPSGNLLNIQLESDAQLLNDVVVIGYGTQRKNDLTGSVTNVSSEDFNAGLISSPEQLINGKASGIQIVSNGGSPTSGSTIRIRGGASLNASNDPLIVLDGVPLESGGISGNSGNFLSLINPADIESMTILKDASSTAIYGSRASNGVILITTKKGSKGLKIDVSSTHSVQQQIKADLVLSPDEYRTIINRNGTEAQKALLGNRYTDWNDEIFRLAYGTDNNVSLATSVSQHIPLRASLGYHHQNGILQTDKAERFSGSLMVSPELLDNHLKMNLSIKATLNKNRFAETGAIYSAEAYNPTIGVYSGNSEFGGFNEALDPSQGTPTIAGQVANPVGLLHQYKSTSEVKRMVGNFDMDYKFHFLPDLKAHLILGLDHAEGEGSIYVPREAAQYYSSGGRNYSYGPEKKDNRLLTFYLNYNKEIESLRSQIDFTAGYDYQKWRSQTDFYQDLNVAGEVQATSAASDRRHVLVSFYGRLNYVLDTKYMLTATVRHDGSSRFSPENRWSTFPSLAVAWRMKEESFLKEVDFLSNLKLRFSYGVTGQQDGIGDYGYIPLYTISQDGAEYLFGNRYYYTYRPEAYVSDLKWESTQSYNVGLDFGFFNNRLSGEIDYYTRKTKDLLATVPSPAGANFDKNVTTNVGNMKSQGLEFSLTSTIIDTPDWSWDVAYNMTWQKMEITNLSLVKGAEAPITYVGSTSGGNYLQVLKEGLAPYSFYLYKQVYDENGKPVEGEYEGDRYNAGSPFPDFMLGLNSQIRYKKWSLGFSLRANFGAKVFNNNAMKMGAWEVVSYNTSQINNLSRSYLETGFENLQYLSDYYLENANFLKMDHISLGYNFGKIAPWCSLNVSGVVQNAFTITGYSGADPEIYQGIESSFYPRARMYSIQVGLQF